MAYLGKSVEREMYFGAKPELFRLKFVIEVDGEIHFNDQAMEHDDGRTGELERYGIKVIRFTNEEVLKNQELIITKIKNFIIELSSPALLGAGDKRG